MNALRHCLLLLLFSALAGAALVAHRPAKGAPLQGLEGEKKSTLGVLDQISQAAIKRSAPFEISEARLNEHLAETVQSRPAFNLMPTSWQMEVPRLDLHLGEATLRLRWRLANIHVCDLAVNFTVRREGKEFRCEVVDGAYGRLNVPRGLLHPAKAVLGQIADVLKPELDALFTMNQIQIAEDQLLLDPRFSESEVQAAVVNR